MSVAKNNNSKKPRETGAFLLYSIATFFWKKSLNFFLVKKVSTILKNHAFFFGFQFLNHFSLFHLGFIS
jgi:hypothetical protein